MKQLTKRFFLASSIVLFILLSSLSFTFAGTLPTGFTETNVVTGLTSPIGMAFLPDGRILVIEQAGRVRLVVNNVLRTAPMLDITADVLDGGEQGLLGLAIDPDYPTRPYVYLYYNNTTPNLQYVVRYTATGTLNNSSSIDLNLDPASRVYLLNDIPNNAGNHNGGTLRFGIDKRLYISMGDDASSCDAQNRTLLKGAIFRIKVDDTIVINSNIADKASLVPTDNPWASAANVNERLVFAYGLRNPFRFNVHPDTGALFIGDVGSGTREEVDISTGGENFGWPYWEGNVTGPNTSCGGLNGTMPIYDYTRGASASVIGGVVYKGKSYPNDASFPPEFNGNFFFNDYYSGNLRVLRWNGSSWNLVAGVDTTNFGTGYSYVSDWTVGPDGAIYYVYQGGSRIVRIAYTQAPVIQTTTLPNGTVGASYNQTLQVTGGTQPYTWSVINGSLPAGLTLNASTGNISGAPTTQGASTFTIQVSDAYTRTDTQDYNLTIDLQPSSLTIITSSLLSGTIGYAYNATLQATGQNTTLPYTWSMQNSVLPPGMNLTTNNNDGIISGTPTQAGTYTFTIRVSETGNSLNSDSRAYTLTVNSAPVNGGGGSGGGSGGDSSGGGGCGFVKDDGKGQKTKGEGLVLMIMLVIALAGIAIARRAFYKFSSDL